MNKNMPVTLSVFPNSRGFGYAVIEGPRLLVDYGIVTIKPISNETAIARLMKIIAFNKPAVILLRAIDQPSLGDSRIASLIGAVIRLAKEMELPIHSYSREQIKNAFEQFGASTKQQIAEKIAGEYEELQLRLPRQRRPWLDEDYNMGIFDAMALIGTHHFLTD